MRTRMILEVSYRTEKCDGAFPFCTQILGMNRIVIGAAYGNSAEQSQELAKELAATYTPETHLADAAFVMVPAPLERGTRVRLSDEIEQIHQCPVGREDNGTAIIAFVSEDGACMMQKDLRGCLHWHMSSLVPVYEYPYA